MRLYRDAPDSLTPVVWYIVPYDRPAFPTWHIFGNRVWEWDTLADDLGDVPGASGYRGGSPTAGNGSHFCGTVDQWQGGCLTTDPLPATEPTTGEPVCCTRRRFLGMGGMIAGNGRADDDNLILQENLDEILQEDGSEIFWE